MYRYKALDSFGLVSRMYIGEDMVCEGKDVGQRPTMQGPVPYSAPVPHVLQPTPSNLTSLYRIFNTIILSRWQIITRLLVSEH